MEPNFPTGTVVMTTPFKKIERNSIVAFRKNSILLEKSPTEYTYLSRIVGLGNEMIEIKEGFIYINDSIFKPPYETQNLYLMSLDDFKNYKNEQGLSLPKDLPQYGGKIFVSITSSAYERLNAKIKLEKIYDSPIISIREYKVSEIVEPSWTNNNFGPVKIPLGKYFVLGDNRGNSLDSRIFGFLDSLDIIGVKI